VSAQRMGGLDKKLFIVRRERRRNGAVTNRSRYLVETR